MRIVIVCNDTRGGIQPYLGLAIGLQSAGHALLFVASSGYRDFIESRGVIFFGLAGDVQQFVAVPENAAKIEKGFFASHKLMIETMRQLILRDTQDCLQACEGADLIISGFGGMMLAEGVAEKLGIPFVQAHVQPISSTSEYSGLLSLGWLHLLGGIANRLSHAVSKQVFWQPMRGAVNLARKEVLGLPPTRFWGTVGRTNSANDLILYGYSSSLLPKPRDWPSNYHVTGYWFLPEDPNWKPSAEVDAFLNSGSKPICVGFGSMTTQNAEATANLILEAAEKSKQRLILLSGWGGMNRSQLPDWALQLESIPHSWLFPRVSLSIHHGGAGTTGASLRAGIPSIIIPFGADQPFWARLIQRKQLGDFPATKKRLTATKLADSISRTLEDPIIRENTQLIGKAIAQEDGIGKAVQLLEQFAQQRVRKSA